MSSETTEQKQVVEAGSEETKQTNIAKLGELLSEGQKKLDAKDPDSAVELLSEATRLADAAYGPFAPETFNAYLQYGRALLNSAVNQFAKAINDDSDSEDDEDDVMPSDEEMPSDQPAKDKPTEEVPKVVEKTKGELAEPSEADMTLNADDEESDDDIENILKDAWSVLEVAKQTCEKQLENAKEEADIRKWKLNLSEPLHALGRVLVMNGESELAKAEFDKAVDLKKQYSNDERALATAFNEIGDTFDQILSFDDAKTYFTKSLESFKKTVGAIEAANGDKKAIDELNAICKDIQEKIDNAEESGQMTLNFKEEVVNMVEKAKVKSDVPATDVSHLVKRRAANSGDAPGKRRNSGLDDSDGIDAKKSKLA